MSSAIDGIGIGSGSQWASEVDTMCDYFVDRCENWDDFWPDTWEQQPYPGQKEDIQELFSQFASFVDVYEALSAVEIDRDLFEKAKDSLNKDDLDSLFHDIDLQVTDWEGDAAESFSEYLRGTAREDGSGRGSAGNEQRPGMENALANCRDRIIAMNYAMKAYRDAIKSFKKDVEKLVKESKDAIEAKDAAGHENAITAVTSVIAIGAAAVATGGSVLLATAAVGTALGTSVAANASYTLVGKDPFAIMISMQEAGKKVLDDAGDALLRVSRAFETELDYLSGIHLLDVQPKRPDVVTDDRYNPDEFNPGQVPGGISHDDLVKEPE